ncbi:MAG: carboxylesterase/lipase family protein [Eubacteriaceae bacterium]
MAFPLDLKSYKTITPPCGPIKGVLKKGIAVFKGIPYAKPPIGNNRFAPPKALEPWQEVLDCENPRAIAMQMGGILADTSSTYRMDGKSEDCLFLNVWTPSTQPQKELPVYVFIHGGAFATGSGTEMMFDGSRMAQEGLIVVTINYRLGAFGFLATDALKKEQGTTGNYGILDQILALKWVQANIKSFGGDPNQVTIGGESAGAFSVTALLLSPLAKGLFNQAIVESGSILSIPAFSPRNRGNLEKTIANGKELCTLFGIEDTLPDLPKLREISGDALAALGMVKSDQSTTPNQFTFWPVFDGVVLPKNPIRALEKGEINPAKLLIGYNTDESTLFIKGHTNLGIYQLLCIEIFGAEKAKKIFETFNVDRYHSPLERLQEVFTIAAFLVGMVTFADTYAKAGHEVFFYNFDYDPAVLKILGLNSAHSMELPFVFGNFIGQGRMTRISNLSWVMHQSWTRFIKLGNPNIEEVFKGKITWPLYDSIKKDIMVFDVNLSNKTLPYQEALEIISQALTY